MTSASALEANDDGIQVLLVLICADADVDPDATGSLLEVDLEASWRSIRRSLGSRFRSRLEVELEL